MSGARPSPLEPDAGAQGPDSAARQAARRQNAAALCSATVRALTGDRRLHYRNGMLWRDGVSVPLAAPHLRIDAAQDDSPDTRGLRGAADGAAMRLLYSDAALHARLRPRGGIQSLVFELLEQLRAESLAPAQMPGIRHNLRRRFETWALGFHDARLADSESGLLLFAVVLLAWMRVTGWPLPERLEGVMEAPRATLSPILGGPMAQLRECRHDQQAYADPAARIAARVAELGEFDDIAREPAGNESPMLAARLAFNVLLPPPGKESDAIAAAPDGVGKILQDDGQQYRAYTRRYDVEARAGDLARPAQLRDLRRQLDKRLAALSVNRAQLGRRLAASLCMPREDGWSFGEETGRLDGRRLAQLVSSPAQRRVFRQELIKPKADSALAFLIDCSGSMKARIEWVAALVDTLVRSLDATGVATEILGFTTNAWNGGRARQDWLARGRPALPGRLNELCHMVFKDADRPWRRARMDIAALLKPDLFREGVDAEAVQWAASRLLKRQVRRRVLVVISDGSPMDTATAQANDPYYLDNHLRQVVARHETTRDIDILGIGIGQDLSPYYRYSLAVDPARPLDTRLFLQVAGLVASAAVTRVAWRS